ncbi:unnamed protein product [Polarella glacialis]|uniref:Uncharacterized protein n=1 Tax=Polarella glacialis TaxID=89957 RepID=A0A813DNZ9_POLGL|nr:unnamed protein product [Polarella glacialis]
MSQTAAAGMSGTGGGGAAYALRALRRAAQLHTARRAAVAATAPAGAAGAGSKSVRSYGGTGGAGGGGGGGGCSQPEPSLTQPLSQPLETVPAWELLGSQQKHFAEGSQGGGDPWGATLSTQTPSNLAPSGNLSKSSLEASQPASQGFSQPLWPSSQPGMSQPVWPSSQQEHWRQQQHQHQHHQPQQPMHHQQQWSSSQPLPSSQPPQTEHFMQQPWLQQQQLQHSVKPPQKDFGYPQQQQPQQHPRRVAEAAAALAAALAGSVGTGAASGDGKRRRLRHKVPPPVCEAPAAVDMSPSADSGSESPSQREEPDLRRRKRRSSVQPQRGAAAGAERVSKEVSALRRVASDVSKKALAKLTQELSLIDEERDARRAGCRQAAKEVLSLLEDHRRACEESGAALVGAVRAADAAIAAAASLERLRASATQRSGSGGMAAICAGRPPGSLPVPSTSSIPPTASANSRFPWFSAAAGAVGAAAGAIAGSTSWVTQSNTRRLRRRIDGVELPGVIRGN